MTNIAEAGKFRLGDTAVNRIGYGGCKWRGRAFSERPRTGARQSQC